jgi:hypothetical protein
MLPELETKISWRSWPLIERGLKGWLLAGFVALLAAGLWLVLLLSLPPVAAFLLGATFIGLLLPYYLPGLYSITEQGVKLERGIFPGRFKSWDNFSGFKETERGYWLIPANLPASSNTLEPLRATFLPYPADPLLKIKIASYLRNILEPQMNTDEHK